jgi:hypothetical protein
MTRSRISAGTRIPMAVATLALVAAVAACSGAGAAPPTVTPGPTAPPAASPVPTPVPVPSAPVGPVRVDLDTAAGDDIVVVIDDTSGTLVKAVSGTGGTGMSAGWGKAKVENIDARTIRVTFAGFARDEDVQLKVSKGSSGLVLEFAQSLPYPNSDGVGADRVLVLEFDGPVSADGVKVTISDPSQS